ncbi:MAG: thiamine-phosphate kinase [Methylotenera sp.]|nr:thiamine-phosphate kinase [Methylotenera sp.]
MSEFDLIRQHFTRTTRYTELGIGDDAALIRVGANMELAISADMLVAGTHFFADADPYQLGWKSLAVNLSDMAAMGAQPRWATLAIALPAANPAWLTEFSRGFFACADRFVVDLIGGDTTRGPLTISVQIMGEVPNGLAIKRSGAQLGDQIWLSGPLGYAALALAHLQAKIKLDADTFAQCASALHAPQPRVALGLALRGIATSAIDISDGLLADLGHVLSASNLGAKLHLNQLPQASHWPMASSLKPAEQLKLLLAGGDDYELCFSAPAAAHGRISQLGSTLGLPLLCVGEMVAERGLAVHGLAGEMLDIKEAGFDHFK